MSFSSSDDIRECRPGCSHPGIVVATHRRATTAVGWLNWSKRSVSDWVSLASLVAGTVSGTGQVVLDGTFGTGGALAGPNYSVTADVGLIRGQNLFHSFTRFDLKAGDVATFSGPANIQIQNVLSRVTGGSPSSIDGTIRSDIAGGNFFFMNPRGVVFGPNAMVDVSGSFAATTADYLKLADGARFVAALDADDSMLSTAPVAAFGFLDTAGSGIEVRGSLMAGSDANLSLVGNTVAVNDGARLEASGRIDLVGVRAAGEIAFAPSPSLAEMNGRAIEAQAAGDGDVVIRGGRLVVNNAMITADSTGGNIDILVTEGLEVMDGAQIRTSSAGSTRGGDIRIQTPAFVIDGRDGSAPTTIAAETFSDDPLAAGGDILVDADTVELRRGAEISVSTFGAADAGRLEISASSLQLEGSATPQFPTQISANAAPFIGGSSGAGGQIVIRADSVRIGNGAGILAATSGDSNAGAIDVTAGSFTLANGAITTFTAGIGHGGEIRVRGNELTLDGPFASITALTTGLNEQLPAGNGGFIDIQVDRLGLYNDAAISANTFGDGRGGNISITADSVVLDHATFQPGSIPGITAASNPSFFGGGGGQGGDISIVAGSLTLRNGMVISTTTDTSGDGGSVDIRAGLVTLESGSSIQSASLANGRAGTLSVGAEQDIRLTGDSTISTSAPRSSGGNMIVEAGAEIRLDQSSITAQAGPGGGGNITLLAPALIYLFQGTVTAQAAGDGGNLTIDPVFFILNDSALISKSTTANGGNITILSDYFFQSSSLIDASAPFGLPGTVSVSAPEVDLSGSLIGLPSSLLGVDTQLRPDCAVRETENISSFVVLGRGGLPPTPGGFVSSGLPPTLDEKQ